MSVAASGGCVLVVDDEWIVGKDLQRRLVGYVNQIYVQAGSPGQVQAVIGQVSEILARRHRIRPGEANDFSVRNLSQIAETAEGSSRIMALPGSS